MTVQLTVRATDGLFSWTFEEWQCLVAVAAVSAQPESLAEYFEAARRYLPNHDWVPTATNAGEISNAATVDGRWCLVDLVSRSILSGHAFELPERRSAVQADATDDYGNGSQVVWLDTPLDWLFEVADEDWLATIVAREEEFCHQRKIDVRDIVYGRSMRQFLADRILVAAARGTPPAEQFESSRSAHGDWLMTDRDDLADRSPRQAILNGHDHITWELQHRADQWSMQGFAVPPLPKKTTAYRFAAFGTIEIVTYFHLIRFLLNAAWQHVNAGIMDSDELTNLLAKQQAEFLNQPPDDDSGAGLLNCELIESERRRMPITADASHLDCDCHICQASVDGEFGTGPMFAFYDGHTLELEDEFAFSMVESRDVWERQQEEDCQMMQKMEQGRSERKGLSEEHDSVWQSSFVDWDKLTDGHATPISPQMALGFPLAEMLRRLKELGADQTHMDSLNLAFTAFRSAADQAAAETAAGGFRTCLENAASEFPELVPQSADLQSCMDEVLRILKTQPIMKPNTDGSVEFAPSLMTTPPILNVIVFRSPGPADDDIEEHASEHVTAVSQRPLGGGLGFLTLEPEDFDRVADGIAGDDLSGTAAAVLHFLGPKAADLIQKPYDLDYCWTITDNTQFERILMLQIVMRPHLLE